MFYQRAKLRSTAGSQSVFFSILIVDIGSSIRNGLGLSRRSHRVGSPSATHAEGQGQQPRRNENHCVVGCISDASRQARKAVSDKMTDGEHQQKPILTGKEK